MFFAASKIFWAFLSPVAVLLMAALIGLCWSGRRFARAIGLAAILILFVAAISPLGRILVAPLEDRFPQPAADLPPPHGIIVLGGAVDGRISKARGQASGEETERVDEAVILAKRYPEARIVFSGGSGWPFDESTEAPQARKLMVELGVDPTRIALEEKSRNTVENARFTAAMVHPGPSERWLIVTSAFHMPRAMGLFRKAGFDAIAYPVAYRTPVEWDINPARNLRVFEIAAREYIGLLAYWATGRIDDLFPGPNAERK